MKIIVGLGNPEPEYTNTRHNIGKDVLNTFVNNINSNDQSGQVGNGKNIVDEVTRKSDVSWKSEKYVNSDICKLENGVIVKPHSFMNDIGQDVSKVVNYFESDFSEFLIIYDELDMVIGEYKLSFEKGSRIHNGINSIRESLKTKAFWHMRIGVREAEIEGSVQKTGRDPSKYVLSKFPKTDSLSLSKTIEESVIPELKTWLSKK